MTKVDTKLLMSAASQIRTKNKAIADAFNSPIDAAKAMDRSWDGAAAGNAVSAFNKLKSRYPTDRSNALESAARVLVAIANGYEMTEEKNESIADRFK